jgi:hypothetical protein
LLSSGANKKSKLNPTTEFSLHSSRIPVERGFKLLHCLNCLTVNTLRVDVLSRLDIAMPQNHLTGLIIYARTSQRQMMLTTMRHRSSLSPSLSVSLLPLSSQGAIPL